MGFKKIFATGMILANLAMPLYAKMYNEGIETKIEKKYKTDIVGDFSGQEANKIGEIMKNVESKIDRKKAGIEYITIKKTKIEDNSYFKNTIGTVDENRISVLLDTERLKEISVSDYPRFITHEIGHLVYANSKEEYFNKWKPYLTGGLALAERTNITGLPGCSLPKGCVSEYPLRVSNVDGKYPNYIMEIQEDFADTFGYWINGKHYADKDKIVMEKINIIKDKDGKK